MITCWKVIPTFINLLNILNDYIFLEAITIFSSLLLRNLAKSTNLFACVRACVRREGERERERENYEKN